MHCGLTHLCWPVAEKEITGEQHLCPRLQLNMNMTEEVLQQSSQVNKIGSAQRRALTFCRLLQGYHLAAGMNVRFCKTCRRAKPSLTHHCHICKQ